MNLEPIQMSGAITVNESALPKVYGFVNRKGKRYIRNYKREIKGGKNFVDIWINSRLESAADAIQKIYDEKLFL